MEDCLCIQTIAKSVILPCDVYADGEYVAHHRRSGMLLLCYFEQDSIQVEHFLQQHRNESSLCIPYCDINHIDVPISRIPYGSLYGVRYHITLNFIV